MVRRTLFNVTSYTHSLSCLFFHSNLDTPHLFYRVNINSFPDYKHLLQENNCTWNTNIFFFQNVTQEVFSQHISTLQHVLLLLHAERLINNQFLSTVFSNLSSVTVAKASVILAFIFVISGTGVENTLSLTYRHKKKSRGVISGDRGGQGVGPSLTIHLFGNVASKNQMLQ